MAVYEDGVSYPHIDIVVVDNAFHFGRALVDAANSIPDGWERSLEQDADGIKQTPARTSSSLFLSGRRDGRLAYWENDKVVPVISKLISTYSAYNKYMACFRDQEYQLLNYSPGEEYKEHCDSSARVPSISSRQLSIVLCFQAPDEGGELEFPRQNVVVEMVEGRAIMFPSNFAFPHIARPVIKGQKVTLVTWCF